MSTLEALSLIPETSTVVVSDAQSLLLSDQWKIVNMNAFERDKRGDIVVDEDGQKVFSFKEINIRSLYEGMPIEYELSIKLALLNSYNSSNGILLGKPSTFTTDMQHYALLKKTMDSIGFRFLKEINQNTIRDFCISLITSGTCVLNYEGLRAKRSFIHALSKLGNLSVNSNIIGLLDYPTIQVIPEDCLQFVEGTVSERMDYKDWLKGGSWGDLPLEIAIVMLCEALEYFESPDLKRVIALVKAVSLVSFENKIIDHVILRQAILDFIKADFERDSDGIYQLVTRNRQGTVHSYKLYRNNFDPDGNATVHTYDIAEKFFNLCDEYEVTYIFDRKMSDIKDLTDAVRESLYRVSGSLSILTGVRSSELESLREDSFEVINERGTFKSKIKKTNNDSETIRPVTIHAEPIAWIACELSQAGYHHGDLNPAPYLLKASLPWYKEKGNQTSIHGLTWTKYGDGRVSLGSFYKELLNNLISDFDISETPLSSHRFRHTWAELAIRRFDGNVPEAIRNYFRHWYSSFMTMDYIRGKLKADLPEISRSYLKELIHRAAYDDEIFYGAAGRFMLSRLKEIDMVDPDQVDSLLDEFDVLEVHEYSFCAIPKKFKSQAKCWDKATQTPRYDDACWNNCGGCAGRLTLGRGTHKDEILRIGMSAQEVINTNNSRGVGNLNGFWNKQLKQAEAALNEFENKMPLVEIETEGFL